MKVLLKRGIPMGLDMDIKNEKGETVQDILNHCLKKFEVNTYMEFEYDIKVRSLDDIIK